MSSITENQIIAAVMCLGTLILCYLMTALSKLITSTALASTLSLMVVALLLSVIVRLMTKSWTAAGLTAIVTFVPLVALYLISPAQMAGTFTSALGALAVFDRMLYALIKAVNRRYGQPSNATPERSTLP